MSNKSQVIKDLQQGGFDLINIQAYIDKPDPKFSAKRNKQIIAETNAENDKRESELNAVTKRKSEEVADILTSYGMYRLGGSGTKKIEGYLGQEWMKKIYGDKLFEKMRIADSVRRLNKTKGNTLYGGNFYLPGKD